MIDPVVLSIAKAAILETFGKSEPIDMASLSHKHPFLAEMGAAFVTLNRSKQLRGCIGSIVAHRTLLEDIIHNAQAAAFSDPRFAPLRLEELGDLTLEVSILTAPEPLEYENFNDLILQLRPHKDGLILQEGGASGTFLPQVWEQLPTPELFLEHLALKAGLDMGVYARHPKIFRYEVNAIKERFDAIPPL